VYSELFKVNLLIYLVRPMMGILTVQLVWQGNFSHSKQYFALFVWKIMQVLILHLIRVTGLLESSPLQPGHLFLSLRYAMQIPQFIPHGAMNEVSFKDSIILFPLFFIFQSRANGNAHRGNCKIPYSNM
jgi:hypothetical protein